MRKSVRSMSPKDEGQSKLITFEQDKYNPGVVTMKASGGSGMAIVKVTYQCCNNNTCLVPETKEFKVKL